MDEAEVSELLNFIMTFLLHAKPDELCMVFGQEEGSYQYSTLIRRGAAAYYCGLMPELKGKLVAHLMHNQRLILLFDSRIKEMIPSIGNH